MISSCKSRVLYLIITSVIQSQGQETKLILVRIVYSSLELTALIKLGGMCRK